MDMFQYIKPARLIFRTVSGWHSRVGSASSSEAVQAARKLYYHDMADLATDKKADQILDLISKKQETGYATIEDIAKVEKMDTKVESSKNLLFLTLKEFFKKVERVKNASDPEKTAEKEAFLSFKFLVDQGCNVDLLYKDDLITIENGKLYVKTGEKLRVNGLSLRPDYRAEKDKIKRGGKEKRKALKEKVVGMELNPKQKKFLEEVKKFLDEYESKPKEILKIEGKEYKVFKDKSEAMEAFAAYSRINKGEQYNLQQDLAKAITDRKGDLLLGDLGTSVNDNFDALNRFDAYSFLTKEEYIKKIGLHSLESAYQENFQQLKKLLDEDEKFLSRDFNPAEHKLEPKSLTLYDDQITEIIRSGDASLWERAVNSRLVLDLQNRISEIRQKIVRNILILIMDKSPSLVQKEISGKNPLEIWEKYPLDKLKDITDIFVKNPWLKEYFNLLSYKVGDSKSTTAMQRVITEYQYATTFMSMISESLADPNLSREDEVKMLKRMKEISDQITRFETVMGIKHESNGEGEV